MDNTQIQVPIICIDMDGVIWRDKAPLPGAKDTIIYLTQDLKVMDPVRF